MKQKIDYYDIEIYGNRTINEDPINAGYNLGDLLNMPFLYGIWEQNPHGGKERLDRRNKVLYEGVEFESQTALAEYLNCTLGNITRLIKKNIVKTLKPA